MSRPQAAPSPTLPTATRPRARAPGTSTGAQPASVLPRARRVRDRARRSRGTPPATDPTDPVRQPLSDNPARRIRAARTNREPLPPPVPTPRRVCAEEEISTTRHRRQTMRCPVLAAVTLTVATPAAATARRQPARAQRSPPSATTPPTAHRGIPPPRSSPHPRPQPPVTGQAGPRPSGGAALAMLVTAGIGVIAGRATSRPRHARA